MRFTAPVATRRMPTESDLQESKRLVELWKVEGRLRVEVLAELLAQVRDPRRRDALLSQLATNVSELAARYPDGIPMKELQLLVMPDDLAVASPLEPDREEIDSPRGPLGAGQVRERRLTLTCEGQAGDGQHLTVFVYIEYRDIFYHKRETVIGYRIDASGRLRALSGGLSVRIKNT